MRIRRGSRGRSWSGMTIQFDHSVKESWRLRLTRRQISLIASSPCVNNVRIARKDAILTLSPAEDHKSRSTWYQRQLIQYVYPMPLEQWLTFRYALTCFLAPITQGNNFVLSPTAINNNPPASSSSFFDTLDGVDGRDLIRCKRVEKWDKRTLFNEALVLFWFNRLIDQIWLNIEVGSYENTYTFPLGIVLYGRWWDTTTGVNLSAVMTILLNTGYQLIALALASERLFVKPHLDQRPQALP